MAERSYCRRWNKCLRRDIFPQLFWSRWPGVTLTMHTMLVDEKTVDLSPLFMDAHNSKVPLSALLTLVHWHFMRGPEPYFDAVKWLRTAAATAVLRKEGTLALALVWSSQKLAPAYKVVLAPSVPLHCCGLANQMLVKRPHLTKPPVARGESLL